MQTNDPEWMRVAMAGVKRYDPALWQEMRDADWYVHVVSPDAAGYAEIEGITADNAPPLPSELANLPASAAALIAQYAVVRDISDAFGVTNMSDGRPGYAVKATWLNRPSIRLAAITDVGVPPELMAADVLVHEYQHRRGDDEPEAYAAGTAFAQKIGGPFGSRIARLSDLSLEVALLSEEEERRRYA